MTAATTNKRYLSCSSSGFPFVGVRLVYWSLCCTATFVICFHWSLLLAFSLHFSSSSAFLRSLFTQSSHLNCGIPRFLHPSCFFVSDLFNNLSSVILTICPAHFIRLLTILPIIQTLVERGSSAVECRTRNQVSPGTNPHLLPFRRLGIFVLSIDAPVDSAL